MVLDIALKNFFSIKEEVVLDLQAARLNTAQAKALEGNTFEAAGDRMLKSVAIFGANASGKSNIIKAIRACVGMILNSHNYNEDTIFDFVPFKFGGGREPSEFFVRFILDGIKYEYSFSTTRTEIIREKLYHYPNGRRSLVFSRDENRAEEKYGKYDFHSVIPRPFDVAANTSRKTLFLSRASQMDREIAQKVFRYFSERFVLDFKDYVPLSVEQLLNQDKETLLEILKVADSEIVDIRSHWVSNNMVPPFVDSGRQRLFPYGGARHLEIETFHRSDPSVPFDFFREESDGTQIFFIMMLTIIDVIRGNKILLLDEIDTSLHTKIVEYMIDLFHRSGSAQLIFTSHNTHLLDMGRMRKDQIYFVNKRDGGSSDLYSLYDFKDFRENMDLEKAYLQGRFDAVPYFFIRNISRTTQRVD